MNNTRVHYILSLSLVLCAHGHMMQASEKTDSQKLSQALRQFQDLSSKTALSALEKRYACNPKNKKMELSPKALKKNGQTKASDYLDF